ncbi:hypothetical protein M1439_00555 [Candidatus Marsarchaeota archaeon]|nr:hypothetical protein [Candidatus Marsarchaeota archaeon]
MLEHPNSIGLRVDIVAPVVYRLLDEPAHEACVAVGASELASHIGIYCIVRIWKPG